MSVHTSIHTYRHSHTRAFIHIHLRTHTHMYEALEDLEWIYSSKYIDVHDVTTVCKPMADVCMTGELTDVFTTGEVTPRPKWVLSNF